MFRRIVLDNYLSFDHLEFNLVGKKDKPLGYALIYGENGSGKTNLISSIRFLKNSIETVVNTEKTDHPFTEISSDIEGEIRDSGPMSPLKRTVRDLPCISRDCIMADADGAMHLFFEFQIGTCKGEYELEFDSRGLLVKEELSYKTEKGGLGKYYSISNTDDGPEIYFGRGIFKGDFSKDLRKRIAKLWGKHSTLAILVSEYAHNNDIFMRNNVAKGVDEVIRMIRAVKVSGAEESGRNVPFNVFRGFTAIENEKILDAYEKALSSYFIRLYTDIRNVYYERRTTGNGLLEYMLFVTKRIAGKERAVPFYQESSGTRKLLEIFPALIECNMGGTAFIDELDSGVHDKLIHDMMNHVLENIDGQLVLTTHNTLLLETAKPNNVFIIRIDNHGFKEIVPISSIVPTQKNHNNRDRYLSGLFDGIPFIRDLNLPYIASDLRHDMEDCRWDCRFPSR